MRHILIATTNLGKLAEIQAGLFDLPLTWMTLLDYPGLAVPHEDGPTFAANADLKALHYAGKTGLWALADDSGLEVDALDGRPGVHSARYASDGTDAANNAKLIAELRGVPVDWRKARFVCCLSLAAPGEVLARARGAVEGRIIDVPRGCNGFGYDPHFELPESGLTTAQLPPAEKNRISHRGQALRHLGAMLTNLLAGPA